MIDLIRHVKHNIHAILVYVACMVKSLKSKIEVFLVETIRTRFEAICVAKGISLAEGLRRAVELWMEENE